MADDREQRAGARQATAEPGGGLDVALSEEDILDAMQRIPGYLDITTADFRAVYELAHRHAIERLLSRLRARDLMRDDILPLAPELGIVRAAHVFVDQGLKSLPVVDAEGRVLGMLTETDILAQLGAKSWLGLLLQDVEREAAALRHVLSCRVEEVMTSPVITVPVDAGFPFIMRAFKRHPGRAMPVVAAGGRLAGLLLRKDFVAACHLGELP